MGIRARQRAFACASSMACLLLRLGEYTERVVLLRTTLVTLTPTAGLDSVGTLATEGRLVNVLSRLG